MTDRIIKVILRGDITGLKASMAAAGASVSDTAKKLTAADAESAKFRRGLTATGDTAGKMGLVAAAGLGLVTKAAMDWETAWAGVTKTVSGTDAELAKVESGLRDLAKTLPATHTEIAGVAEAAGQLGVATDDIVSFTKTMIDLGETTNLTAEDAATAIAQMANVMGTSGDDVDNLGSALVALGNDGASTERQIIEMAQGISGAAAIVGLAESDVLAIANAVASMGIEVEAGGTAVSRVLTDMAKATSQGGKNLELFAKTAGLSADEFATAFADRPAEAFAAFTNGLDQVRASGGDVFTVLDQLGLSDVRVSRALLGMAASGDLLTNSLELGSKAWAENTALTDEAQKRYDTAASRVQVSINEIKDSMIEFGDTALPIVADVAEAVGDVASVFGDLPGPVKQATSGLLAITAITGGAFWFGTKVISSVSNTRAAIADLGDTAPKTAAGLRGLVRAGVALAALAAAGEAIEAIEKSAAGAAPEVEALTSALIDANNAEFVREFGGNLKDALDQVDQGGFDGLIQNFDELAAKGGAVGTAVGRGLGSLVGINDDMSLSSIEAQKLAGSFDSLDKALTGAVTSGSPAQAQKLFTDMAIAQGLSADQQEELLALLPGYRAALAGAANDADLAADAQDGLTSATLGTGDAAQVTAEEIEGLVQAMRDQRDAALSAFDAETQWRQALKDATEQAKKSNAGIKGSSDEAIANREQISKLAAAWNNQSDAVKNNRARFREAREAFIAAATGMGVGEEAAKRLARRLLEIPERRVVRVSAETGDASAKIQAIINGIAKIKDKHITITATTNANVAEANVGADGATVPKTGLGYADRHPYLLADGEEVVSDRYGGATKNRPELKAASKGAKLAVVGMADGGTAGLATQMRPVMRLAAGGTTGTAGAAIDYDRWASAVAGNRLLNHRDTRAVLEAALRTVLGEMPMLRASDDASMLGLTG